MRTRAALVPDLILINFICKISPAQDAKSEFHAKGASLRILFATVIVLIGLPAIISGAKASDCQIEKKATLALGFANGLATVRTKIDGKVAIMGVDTASTTLVTPQAAATFHLKPDWRQTQAVGTSGVVTANHVLLGDFEFAGTHYHGKSVPKIGLPAGQNSSNAAMGLIGSDVLSDYDLDFDFPHRKLTIYKVTGCNTVTPPDFAIGASIPFKSDEQQGVLLPVELDGKKIVAIVDTGSADQAISREAALRVGVTAAKLRADPRAYASGIGDVTAEESAHVFKTLTVGNDTIRSVVFGVTASPLEGGDMLLGQQFLFKRRFFISNSSRTYFLENASAPRVANKSGPSMQVSSSLTSTPKPTTVRDEPPQHENGYLGVAFGHVSSECLKVLGSSESFGAIARHFGAVSPGRSAGLLLGDIVVGLNEAPVSNGSAVAVAIRMSPPGQKAKLKILRGKRELTLEAVLDNASTRASDKGGFRAEVEEAIEADKAILAELPREGCAMERALAQIHLGISYGSKRALNGTDDYLELAIKSLEEGLAALDSMKFPQDWGAGQINLAAAYRARSYGGRSQNIEREIEAYNAVLALDSRSMPRLNRGRAYTSRALAYMLRGLGARAENLEHALQDLRLASQTFNPLESPKDWADMHRVMAAAYLARLEGRREKNMEDAIAALEIASHAYYGQALPADKNVVLVQLETLKKERSETTKPN